jgi:transcription elongation factor Elf1
MPDTIGLHGKIKCPYCGHEQVYNGDGMAEDEMEDMECSKCEKEFEISCHYERYFWSYEKKETPVSEAKP